MRDAQPLPLLFTRTRWWRCGSNTFLETAGAQRLHRYELQNGMS